MTGSADRDRTLVESTLGFCRQTADWLAHHHANLGRDSTHDLDSDDRWNAVWKLSGQALAHTYALLELLQAGYTGQTWALLRSIHEVDRLLAAVCNLDEERIQRRWLADQKVTQSEARAAEQAEVEKFAEELRKAGMEPVTDEVAQFSQQIYAGMSKAAHHRRSVVDEAVDSERRTMIYGPDPRWDRRVAFTVYAGALVHEVTLLVGGAMAQLYGPGFYAEHLAPMLRQLETVLEMVDFIDVAGRMGSRPTATRLISTRTTCRKARARRLAWVHGAHESHRDRQHLVRAARARRAAARGVPQPRALPRRAATGRHRSCRGRADRRTPGVLAIAGQGLFVVIFEPTDEDAHEPVVERLPLTAEAVTLRIREHQRKLPSGRRTLGEQGGNVDALVRQWTLPWPGSRRVSFSSVVRRFGGFDTRPDAAEPFGETLAGRLGWTIPA